MQSRMYLQYVAARTSLFFVWSDSTQVQVLLCLPLPAASYLLAAAGVCEYPPLCRVASCQKLTQISTCPAGQAFSNFNLSSLILTAKWWGWPLSSPLLSLSVEHFTITSPAGLLHPTLVWRFQQATNIPLWGCAWHVCPLVPWHYQYSFTPE